MVLGSQQNWARSTVFLYLPPHHTCIAVPPPPSTPLTRVVCLSAEISNVSASSSRKVHSKRRQDVLAQNISLRQEDYFELKTLRGSRDTKSSLPPICLKVRPAFAQVSLLSLPGGTEFNHWGQPGVKVRHLPAWRGQQGNNNKLDWLGSVCP